STLTSLLAATFIGGTSTDSASALAVDDSGNVYISGTAGTGFPTTSGAYDETQNGSGDAFVAQFNSSLTSLLASTFIGGASTEEAFSITLDSSGNVYAAGRTASSNFPSTIGAYDETYNGNGSDFDAFVALLNPSLTTLSASTFIGSSEIGRAHV